MRRGSGGPARTAGYGCSDAEAAGDGSTRRIRCASSAFLADVAYEQVSGEGIVYSFTINHQPWLSHLRDPYTVIVVELDEQPGLRFVSRLVETDVADVRVGLRVRVVFEPLGDGLFAPLFTAAGEDG